MSSENKFPRNKRRLRCCVFMCYNSTVNSPNLQFYKFPTSNIHYPQKLARRNAWLKAVKLKNEDGSPWIPTTNSVICSTHFIGNKKSDDSRSPSYNPVLFPSVYKCRKVHEQTVISSYKYQLKKSNQQAQPVFKVEEIYLHEQNSEYMNMSEYPINIPVQPRIEMEDKELQIDIIGCPKDIPNTFICNRYISTTVCEAETQTYCSGVIIKSELSSRDESERNLLRDKNNQTYSELKQENDKSSQTYSELKQENVPSALFHGFSSTKNEQELIDLCGVTFPVFNFLLKLLPKNETSIDKRFKTSDENKLLIFLMKIKCDLTYSALHVLFNIHRTSISRIVKFTLNHLLQACENRSSEKVVKEKINEEDVENTDKIARVRIHIEKIIERIRAYKIVEDN